MGWLGLGDVAEMEGRDVDEAPEGLSGDVGRAGLVGLQGDFRQSEEFWRDFEVNHAAPYVCVNRQATHVMHGVFFASSCP